MRKQFLSLVILILCVSGAVMPALAQNSVLDIINSDSGLTILASAINTAGLTDILTTSPAITIFAPTNTAFEALGKDAWAAILADADTLRSILTYHTVIGSVGFSDILLRDSLPSADGHLIHIMQFKDRTSLNKVASFIVTDIPAGNGIVHIINAVLLPTDEAGLRLSVTPAAQSTNVPVKPPQIASSITPTPAPVLQATTPALVTAQSHIRLINLTSPAMDLDLYVGGLLEGQPQVHYGSDGGWVQLPQGAYLVKIAPAGKIDSDSALPELKLNLQKNVWQTVVVIGSELKTFTLVEDYSALNPAETRISVFHGIADGGKLNVYYGTNLAVSSLAYPGTQGNNDGLSTFRLKPGEQTLHFIRSAESKDFATGPALALQGGYHYFVALAGSSSAPEIFVLPFDMQSISRK